jgi:hypothetical protein
MNSMLEDIERSALIQRFRRPLHMQNGCVSFKRNARPLRLCTRYNGSYKNYVLGSTENVVGVPVTGHPKHSRLTLREIFRGVMKRREVKVLHMCPPHVAAPALGDSVQLRQVLLHVLGHLDLVSHGGGAVRQRERERGSGGSAGGDQQGGRGPPAAHCVEGGVRCGGPPPLQVAPSVCAPLTRSEHVPCRTET